MNVLPEEKHLFFNTCRRTTLPLGCASGPPCKAHGGGHSGLLLTSPVQHVTAHEQRALLRTA